NSAGGLGVFGDRRDSDRHDCRGLGRGADPMTSGGIFLMAVLTGVATWAFRALPTMLMRSEPKPGGLLARFLAATGPAAIATLFVASILPQLMPVPRDVLPLVAGVAATVAAF